MRHASPASALATRSRTRFTRGTRYRRRARSRGRSPPGAKNRAFCDGTAAALSCSRVSRLSALVCLVLAACQQGTDRPSPSELVRPLPTNDPDSPDGSVIIPGDDGGCGVAAPTPFCGQTFLREVNDPPNLYFVVDRSGSMGAPFEGSVLSKYHTARASIADLLYDIGHRVRYGAAVFPSKLHPEAVRTGRSNLRRRCAAIRPNARLEARPDRCSPISAGGSRASLRSAGRRLRRRSKRSCRRSPSSREPRR